MTVTTNTSTVQSRRASLAALTGGALEYYDFLLFGAAAALIFPTVFFPDPSTSLLLSMATFGVAYIARPLGAVVMGHFGDRVGRKKVLIVTLVMMGIATFLIGCLPSYAVIGPLAPMLLVGLRLVQGFSAGAETAGAGSLSFEHAPEGRRAFFSSWTTNGLAIGLILANLAFIPVTLLPDEALFSWGWRIPFFLSAVVFLIALFIRRRLQESEEFTELRRDDEIARVPLFTALRSNWRGVLRVALATFYLVLNTVTAVFALGYAVSHGLDRTTMLWAAIVANLLGLAVRPLTSTLSDRIGRKPVFVTAVLCSGAMVFVFFWAITEQNVPLLFLSNFIMTGLFIAAADSVYPAFFSEMFPAKVRFTGLAVGLQLGFIVSGFAPVIGGALAGPEQATWLPVAIFTAACTVIAAIAALTGRETFRTPRDELGYRVSRSTNAR